MIGTIIADGFADDPVNLWTFGGTGAMAPSFTAMAHHLYLRAGFGHVNALGNAGTLWLPPDVPKAYGIGNLPLAWHICRHGGPGALRRSLAIDGFMTGRRAALPPHFYLFAIAVNANERGRGMGSRLMRQGLALADARRLPTYLENSKQANISFYQNHGFKLMEEVTPTPGCPPLWLMWRPAR